MFHATTIVGVRHNGEVAIAGDGQVTMGETTIMKATAKKVRKIYNDQVLVGFAGSVADAFHCVNALNTKLNSTTGTCSAQRLNWLRTGVRIRRYVSWKPC